MASKNDVDTLLMSNKGDLDKTPAAATVGTAQSSNEVISTGDKVEYQ